MRAPATSRRRGGVLSIQPNSDLGMRFVLGYAMGDGWDIAFTYTGIDWNDYQYQVAAPGTFIWNTRSMSGNFSRADAASDKLSMDYQVIDLETGNRLQLADNTLLRLLFGFRYARINSENTVQYDPTDDDVLSTTVIDNICIEGWGLRVGGEVHRQLGLGFSIFGKSSASLLIGEVNGLHAEVVEEAPDDDFRTNYTQALPVVDVAVGLNWQYGVFDFAFGYEMANWFNLPQSSFFNDNVHRGQFSQVKENLLIDGFFFRFGIVR